MLEFPISQRSWALYTKEMCKIEYFLKIDHFSRFFMKIFVEIYVKYQARFISFLFRICEYPVLLNVISFATSLLVISRFLLCNLWDLNRKKVLRNFSRILFVGGVISQFKKTSTFESFLPGTEHFKITFAKFTPRDARSVTVKRCQHLEKIVSWLLRKIIFKNAKKHVFSRADAILMLLEIGSAIFLIFKIS